MKKVLLVLCLITGILLCVDAIVLLTFTLSFGNIIVLCLGIVLILIGTCYNRFSSWLQKATKVAMGICVPVFVVMICFIAINGNKNSTTFTEDYVIVLGAGIKGEKLLPALQSRLDKCLEYMKQNPNATIIVSGGQGTGEAIPEALAMERYLVANGICKSKIIKEQASTDTYENFEFSKQIIDSLSKGSAVQPSIVYITNNFHSYRAGSIAKRQSIEANSYSSSLPLYMHPPTYLREVLSVFKFWIYR